MFENLGDTGKAVLRRKLVQTNVCIKKLEKHQLNVLAMLWKDQGETINQPQTSEEKLE